MQLILRPTSGWPFPGEAGRFHGVGRREAGQAAAMTMVLLLSCHPAVGANEARTDTAKSEQQVEAAGPSLDRSGAEDVIFQYLAQDLPFLVGLIHRDEYLAELEADPPRFDAQDHYHFNPPGGLLEFEYDGARGALIVRAAIHRYRGRQQGHGRERRISCDHGLDRQSRTLYKALVPASGWDEAMAYFCSSREAGN